MFTKLMVVAAGLAVLFGPAAAVAWGDPADPNDAGVGAGGVPGKIASIVRDLGVPGVGRIAPPGTGSGPNVLGTSDLARMPGSVPDVVSSIGAPNPGAVVKIVTPGCTQGSLGCQ